MTVFFDVDHTLLRKSSGEIYGRYLYKRKQVSLKDLLQISGWALAHRLNALDLNAFLDKSMRWLKGRKETWLQDTCRRCVEELFPPYIYPKALARVHAHQEAGERVFLLSAASRYIIDPFVEWLAIDGCLATDLDVKDGCFTGKVKEPFCYGEGKLVYLNQFCEKNGIALSQCAYYGDSYTDVPVLAKVGRPFAVNPDVKLRREARRNGWPILIF